MKVKLKPVRGAFLSLFKAVPFEEGAEPKFKGTFLAKKGSPQAELIEKGLRGAAKKAWGDKWKAKLAKIRNNPQKCCVQDGDGVDYDGWAGHIAVSAKNTVRPTVLDRDKTPLTAEDGRPYSGCYVMAIIEFFAYKQGGISASLKGVQFIKDGEAFAGGRPADEDEFDDLGDGADDDDDLDEDSDEDADEDEDDEPAPKSKKKKRPVEDEDDEDEDFDEDDAPPPKKKKKKPVDDEDDEEMLDDEDDEPAPKKKKKRPPVDEDDED